MNSYWQDSHTTILQGDAREVLRGLIVRRATAPSDYRFIRHLSRIEAAAVGFLGNRYEKPRPSDYCLIVERNGEAVGYAYGSTPVGRPARVWQIAVRRDARFLEHGQALVQAIERLAERAGATTISARCAQELPSNAFWQAEDFQRVAIARGQVGDGYAKNGRILNVWVKDKAPLLIPRDGEAIIMANRRSRASGP